MKIKWWMFRARYYKRVIEWTEDLWGDYSELKHPDYQKAKAYFTKRGG